MEVDYLLLFLHTCINIVYSPVIVNKYELTFFSPVSPAFASLFRLSLLQSRQLSISCLVFVISPPVNRLLSPFPDLAV